MMYLWKVWYYDYLQFVINAVTLLIVKRLAKRVDVVQCLTIIAQKIMVYSSKKKDIVISFWKICLLRRVDNEKFLRLFSKSRERNLLSVCDLYWLENIKIAWATSIMQFLCNLCNFKKERNKKSVRI